MSTVIKLKRADSGVTLENGVDLARGEPAIDLQNGLLYVGKGGGLPGFIFESTASSLGSHEIANTTGVGESHYITANRIGQVLRASSNSTAEMKRLGYYDLGPSNSLGVPSAFDTTGKESRWHWMGDHVGVHRSIFFTEENYSYVGQGGPGNQGSGNMAHSGREDSDWQVGCQVDSLSYAYIGGFGVDTNAGSNYMPLVAYYDEDDADNKLGFRQLRMADLVGGGSSVAHNMVSSTHQCTASSIFYSSTTNTMTSASYVDSPTNSVLKKVNNTTLVWGKLGYADLEGTFAYLSSTANENDILRYSKSHPDGTGWLKTTRIHVADKIGNLGIHIENSTSAISSPYLKLERVNVPTTLEIMTPSGSDTQFNGNLYVSQQNGAIINVKGNHKTFGIFTTYDPRVLGDTPNFRLTSQGACILKVPTTISNNLGIVDGGASSSYRDLQIVGKTITYTTASKDILPQWNGIEIGEIIIEQNGSRRTASANTVSQIRLGSISISSISAVVDSHTSHQALRFINAGDLETGGDIGGILMGTLTTLEGSSGQRYTTGIRITAIVNNNDITTTNNSGVISYPEAKALSILSMGAPFGKATVVYGASITGRQCYGMNIINMNGSYSSIGINIEHLVSERNAIGLRIKNLTTTAVTSVDRRAGVLVDMGSSTDETILDVHRDISWAIYTKSGRHYFGGATDIVGNVAIDGNVTVDENKTVTITGVEDNFSLTVSYGSIRVARGNLTISEGDLNVTTGNLNIGGIISEDSYRLVSYGSDQEHDDDDWFTWTPALSGGLTSDTSSIKCLTGSTPLESSTAKTIYRLRPGNPGQLLTLAVLYMDGRENHMELRCAPLSSPQTASGSSSNPLTWKSNLVLNDSNSHWGASPDYDASQELHIHPNYPVVLQYFPNFRTFPLTWISNTGDVATDVAAGAYGAWVVLTSGKRSF